MTAIPSSSSLSTIRIGYLGLSVSSGKYAYGEWKNALWTESSKVPTNSPTVQPTTSSPTDQPTGFPTRSPTFAPTHFPTSTPTATTPISAHPSRMPTAAPIILHSTNSPTPGPTEREGVNRTIAPSLMPTSVGSNFDAMHTHAPSYWTSNDKTPNPSSGVDQIYQNQGTSNFPVVAPVLAGIVGAIMVSLAILVLFKRRSARKRRESHSLGGGGVVMASENQVLSHEPPQGRFLQNNPFLRHWTQVFTLRPVSEGVVTEQIEV